MEEGPLVFQYKPLQLTLLRRARVEGFDIEFAKLLNVDGASVLKGVD